jgi:hypothetical protein
MSRCSTAARCARDSADSSRPGTIGPYADLVVLLGPESDVGQAVATWLRKALRRWKQATGNIVVEITDQRAPGDTRRARAMLRLAGRAAPRRC